MSVYIKGMEMPDRCFSCPMCDIDCCGISRGPYIEYREIEVDVALEGRPDWCPLVPIPPHGDLIDRDVILNNKGVGTQIAGWGKMYHETVLEYAPTIIPASGGKENE